MDFDPVFGVGVLEIEFQATEVFVAVAVQMLHRTGASSSLV